MKEEVITSKPIVRICSGYASKINIEVVQDKKVIARIDPQHVEDFLSQHIQNNGFKITEKKKIYQYITLK